MRLRSSRISRRTVLRGLGTSLALPWLEAMTRAGGAETPPRRMAFLYVPNGKHMPDWTPATEGAEFTLPPTLEALAPFRDDLLVLSGLTHDKARPHGAGAGDHARACASFLTGVKPFKSEGDRIRAGVSIDQVAAEKIGSFTRFRSLEIGCEEGRQSGQCDSGYACVYLTSLSWQAPQTPMTKETRPRLLFERLFGDGDRSGTRASRAIRARRRKSILDFVREDTLRLEGRLGSADRAKLDEYLTGVRELERRLEHGSGGTTGVSVAGAEPPEEPTDYRAHLRWMSDLLVLAFQGDLTRIATFQFSNELSNRTYGFLGVPEGHHTISHHGEDEEMQRKIRLIDRFHVGELAYFLGRLRDVQEGDSNLLERSMVLYGSGISDGNRHNHDELPILLAGHGGGTLSPGRHVRYPAETPVCNLFLSILDRMEIPVATHGDATGRLSL